MGKSVIVTGASRGIGSACAVEFAKAGWNVLINYSKNEEAAIKTKNACTDLGAVAEIYRCDVSDPDEVRRMVAFCECEFGGIDALINNAGISESGLFTDFTYDMYRRIFDINVLGQMNCAKEAARVMIGAGHGRIVNISSMWGLVGASCEVLYSASKAAVIGFTKALAKELALSRINVNCIAPGVIDTDMNKCYDEETMAALCEETPLSRLGEACDIAKTALFLCEDGSSFITGEVINVSGGFVI